MKPSRYIRVQISTVVRVSEPRVDLGVRECAMQSMLDALGPFVTSSIEGAECLLPGTKLTFRFAREPKTNK